MAYITKYNFGKIFREIRGAKAFEGVAVDGKIYPTIDFDFFNKMEKDELLQFKAFVSDPDLYIEHYLEYYKTPKNSLFLNEEKQPAYHSDPRCERLLSDFTGFLIPDSIKSQGEEVVQKFCEFYHKNKTLFENNPEAFEMRASLVFKVRIKIDSITLRNSGVKEVDNSERTEIEERIKKMWSDMKTWISSGLDNRKKRVLYKNFSSRTFLVTSRNYASEPIKYNKTGYSDNDIREFLNLLYTNYKKPIMELIKQYYMAEVNPNLKLDGKLLERLGFVPCLSCHGLPSLRRLLEKA